MINSVKFNIQCKNRSENSQTIDHFAVNNNSDTIFESLAVYNQILQDEFSNIYLTRVELLKNMAPEIILSFQFCLLKDEHIIEIKNLFSFNQKYFLPLFKNIKTNKRNLFLHASRNYKIKHTISNAGWVIFDFIIDASYIHPSWDLQNSKKKSTASRIQKKGTEYICNFSIFEIPPAECIIPMMPMMYPYARKACFILTDHSDFDTTEKLRIFLFGNANDGWLNNQLKITKGVFTLSSKAIDFNKNDSLEDKDYCELIQLLYADGSEIAPHALKSKGQIDRKSFENAFAKICSYFQPQTWIDHGSYLKYCYSQGGKYNSEYKLTEALKKHGFNNLWSFHDVNIDAVNTLNIFSNKKFSNRKVVYKILFHLFHGNFMIALHFLRGILHRNYKKNIVTDYLIYMMSNAKGLFIKFKHDKRNVFSELRKFVLSSKEFKRHRDAYALPYSHQDILEFSDAIFTEEGLPLCQYKDGDLLMFSTFETTHIKDIYHHHSLQKLIAEYGLHVGHTYILNDLPYLNNIFTKTDGKTYLSSEWKNFTKSLSNLVNEGVIWNANMGEFCNYLICLLNLEIKYINAACLNIINKNQNDINGFTLIIPFVFKGILYVDNNVISPKDNDDNFWFYVFRLPARSHTNIKFVIRR